MPQGRPTTAAVNKEALNALVDLYYLYVDLATHIQESNESPQDIDIFFLRPGGLKELLQKYYTLASLDPEEVVSPENPLTLESMLPITHSISALKAHQDTWQHVMNMRGYLKEYNNTQHAYGTPLPQEVMEVVVKGKQLIAKRTQRSRSGADAATVDIASAVIAYQDNTLLIDMVRIPFRRNTLGDLVLEFMYTNHQKNEDVNIDTVANWIIDSTGDENIRSRAIKDKCRSINDIVKERLVTELELFDTSAEGIIKRNY